MGQFLTQSPFKTQGKLAQVGGQLVQDGWRTLPLTTFHTDPALEQGQGLGIPHAQALDGLDEPVGEAGAVRSGRIFLELRDEFQGVVRDFQILADQGDPGVDAQEEQLQEAHQLTQQVHPIPQGLGHLLG